MNYYLLIIIMNNYKQTTSKDSYLVYDCTWSNLSLISWTFPLFHLYFELIAEYQFFIYSFCMLFVTQLLSYAVINSIIFTIIQKGQLFGALRAMNEYS
jgi:hypothetical protein